MKAQFFKEEILRTQSLSIIDNEIDRLNNHWHYHPEVEILQLHEGSGNQYVGDNIKRFSAGDIVIYGSNLPHCLKLDDAMNKSLIPSKPLATSIHFLPNFWGDKFLELNENRPIRLVLARALKGLHLTGNLRNEVSIQLDSLRKADGPDRIIFLIKILLSIYRSQEVVQISSMKFDDTLLYTDNDRIDTVYEYTFNNFQKKISLEIVASKVSLNRNSFCRYFKSKTGKTYSQFLTEIRIGHACKLLMEEKYNIKEICYKSGFMNFSCFYLKFKEITGKSPQTYRTDFLSHIKI